jgi:hypothetical protein
MGSRAVVRRFLLLVAGVVALTLTPEAFPASGHGHGGHGGHPGHGGHHGHAVHSRGGGHQGLVRHHTRPLHPHRSYLHDQHLHHDSFLHHNHFLFLGGFGYFYGYPYGYAPYGYVSPYGLALDYGLIDTDVEPEEAEVYVDGSWVGTADDFDGYPGYLALPPGRHTLEFRLEGYAPYGLSLYASPGAQIRVARGLHPLGSAGPTETEPHGGSGALEPRPGPEPEEWTTSPTRIAWRLDPADAALYLDGARQRQTGPATVVTTPGTHTIEAVRPGYGPFRQEVRIPRGRTVSLDIRLEPEDSGFR